MGAHAFFSKNSLASFTFVARYGLPPRSGWLSSISVRCALRTLSLVRLLSLWFPTSARSGHNSQRGWVERGEGADLSDRISAASRLFMRGSKPPL